MGEATEASGASPAAAPSASEEHSDRLHRTGIANPDQVVLKVDDIVKTYKRRRGMTSTIVNVVQNVSFTLERGQIVALVGQSGSGKSTIGPLVTGVEHVDSRPITFTDEAHPVDIKTLGRKDLKDYRRHAQLIFQDPYAALNPVHTIAHSLSRPLQNYRNMSSKEARAESMRILDRVGLTPAERFIDKFPHQLSGGQQQRVVVARALAPQPEILIADEPTSMLDVSIRAEILDLLNDLVRAENLAMLFITHDLLNARMLADEILVLNHGRIVESGSAAKVIEHPQDEYTRLLLNSIPNPFTAANAAAD
ncbi:MAG: ABC transporter ATP-binding protein [Thermomicrobiales bacterium]